MSQSINWCQLESQFFASSVFRKKLAKMVNVVDGMDEAFIAGRSFVKNYDQTNSNLDNDLKQIASHINYQSADDEAPTTCSQTRRINEIYRQIEELNVEGKFSSADEATVVDDIPSHDPQIKADPIDTTKIKWWEREVCVLVLFFRLIDRSANGEHLYNNDHWCFSGTPFYARDDGRVHSSEEFHSAI